MAQNDTSLLEAALVGYQVELARITGAIADLQKRLGKPARRMTLNGGGGSIPTPFKKKHRISAEGRARIAAAQRKRWAAQKKAKD